MKFPTIDGPVYFNIGIILISAFVGWFTLLMGGAHLIEGFMNPDPTIPIWESALGVVFCIALCVIGLFSIWVTIGAALGIYDRFKKNFTS